LTFPQVEAGLIAADNDASINLTMGGEKSELTKLNWTIENVPCKTLVLPLKMHYGFMTIAPCKSNQSTRSNGF
jgi:hypothetical protein